MAIAGEIAPVQHAIFADTGWEPQAVYSHVTQMRDLAENAGIQFHIVRSGNIRDDALNPDARFGGMPVFVVTENDGAMARRGCTSEYKLKPLVTKQRELAGLLAGERCKEHRITTVIGISLDEAHRMKDPLFSWIRNEYPLVDLRMTRHDCVRYHETRGVLVPPRSACLGCPYHSDAEWRRIRDTDPQGWANAVDFDAQIRNNPTIAARMFNGRAYLHRQRVPLPMVDLTTDEERGQLSMFGNDCEGMCGV